MPSQNIQCTVSSLLLSLLLLVLLLLLLLLLLFAVCNINCQLIGTSKAGLDMLTKMMGLELGPHKVYIQVCLLIQ